jgi:HNH endonuclease
MANPYPRTPESRRAHSEFMKQRWQDPEYRRRQSENTKKHWQNPAYRRAQSERTKALWEMDRERRTAAVRRSMAAYWKHLSPDAKERCIARIRDSRRASGARNGNWKGGRNRKGRRGYIFVNIGPGRYRAEHRLIAERALGRPLKRTECVHHLNNVPTDNRAENLLICSIAFHSWLERRVEWRTNREKVSRDRRKAQLASTAARVRNRTRQ